MTVNNLLPWKQRLAERTGLDADLLDRPAVAGFVERRRLSRGLPDDAAYYAWAMGDAGELDRLVEEVAVAETWFGRYPASFQLLSQHAAKLLPQRERLQMLSIACATGEEPYGMAMAAAAAGWPLERIAVRAVDRNERSLALARAGVYRRNAFRDGVPEWAARWIRWDKDQAHVDARLAACVTFTCQDVLRRPRDLASSFYDAVFCRNLMIYLSDAARTTLIDYLASLVSPEGLLFVGHAEPSALAGGRFEPAGVKRAFALRRRQSNPETAAPARPQRSSPASAPARPKRRPAEVAKPAARAMPPPAQPSHQDVLASARALADSGQLAAAIAALEGLDPASAAGSEAFELLGSIQLSAGRLEDARAAFKKALYFEPNHEAALLQMAIVCDRLGDAGLATRYRRRAARAHREESERIT